MKSAGSVNGLTIPDYISLRDYAIHRGVSPAAVSKAVRDGRLRESVVVIDGEPKIGDVDLADREWDANTRPRVDRSAAAASPEEAAYRASRAAREAAALRRESAQAELAELELAERRGQLVDVEHARASVIEAFSLVKTKLLAVPSGVGQRLPHLASDIVPIVDELIREALEELADRGNDGAGND